MIEVFNGKRNPLSQIQGISFYKPNNYTKKNQPNGSLGLKASLKIVIIYHKIVTKFLTLCEVTNREIKKAYLSCYSNGNKSCEVIHVNK